MLKFKNGVPLQGLQPDMLYCLDECNAVFKSFGYDCIVTSTTDGKHMVGSKHYIGYAGDLRRRHVKDGDIELIDEKLKTELGNDYDVVLESDHWHVEYDPKG